MKRLVALILAVAAGALVGAAHGAAPLQTRLLKGTDMPGFWPDQPHELAPSVKAWYAHCLASVCRTEMKAMRARGFVAGARQHLNGPGAEAFSAAIEFTAPRGARAEVAAAITDARLGSSLVTPIRVEGIPNARAVATANSDTKGYVIVFADGRFLYHLAVFFPRDSTKPLPYQRVLAGAQALHRRVHSSR